MNVIDVWLDFFLPICSIIIPVFATLYTVNNRIKNQNRENHQPYVVLDSIVDIDKINEFSYYLTPVGRNFRSEYPVIDFSNIQSKNDINVKLVLKNIGYGVATNIKFYNLLTGNQVHGTQSSNLEQNQKLFTTFDMQAGEEKGIQARVINLVCEDEDEILIEDHIRMLVVYHDLNGNIYNFILSINAKAAGHYDFFAYQPSSKSYKNWKKEKYNNYKKIIREYE